MSRGNAPHPVEKNSKAHLLLKLASSKTRIQNNNVIHKMFNNPNLKEEINMIKEELEALRWMTPILKYITNRDRQMIGKRLKKSKGSLACTN